MNFAGKSRALAWGVGLFGLLAVASCSDDDPPPPEVMDPVDPPSHCSNRRKDRTETGIDCGGADCKRCDLGDTCLRATDCRQGICIEEFCQDARCGNGKVDVGEADVDCGGSLCLPCSAGRACTVSGDCDSRVCADRLCAEPACDDAVWNGDEIELDCGGSCPGCAPGTPCTNPSDCASGLCELERCQHDCAAGTGDCDENFLNECETDTTTSALHCGTCANVCSLANAEPACAEGECLIERCEPGFEDCNGLASDGCEIETGRDPKNCGRCEHVCSENHAMADCRDGACALTCDFGFDDCDHSDTNGCEVEIGSDPENCGRCGTQCLDDAGKLGTCRGSACVQ